MGSYFVIGLDLGQTTDFTALAIVERADADSENGSTYSLRHLQRFQLGTPYTEIVPSVARLAAMPPLTQKVSLVVDHTGVGRPVVDMLRRAAPCSVIPVTITGGSTVTVSDDGSRHVPKKELVTCLQLLMQGHRLRIARSLPDANVLVREMENFRVKITTAAHETFGAWRENQHDDLVLATALACWWAERGMCGPFKVTADPKSRSLIADAPEGVFLS